MLQRPLKLIRCFSVKYNGFWVRNQLTEVWALGTAGFLYNYGITAAPFVRVTFTCAGLLEGTAFERKQGQRVVYIWTPMYLKLPFVKIRHISDILCAGNAVVAQKWHKSLHFTRHSAGRVWHIVYAMGTGRNISSHRQRKAAEVGYTPACAWAPPGATSCHGLSPAPSPPSSPSPSLRWAHLPPCRASARAVWSDIGY